MHYEETLGGVAIDLRHISERRLSSRRGMNRDRLPGLCWSRLGVRLQGSSRPIKRILQERRTFAIGDNVGPLSNSEDASLRQTG